MCPCLLKLLAMSRIALLYITRDGQTRKIIERIAHCLEQKGHSLFVSSITDLLPDFSLEEFDAVMLGCAIRYGKHHKKLRQFIDVHMDSLKSRKSYFFSVNLTARKPSRSEPHNNIYLKKFIHSIDWIPDRVAVFAGALNYTRYDPFNRTMIRLIMKMTDGPVDISRDIEFTDWKRVSVFAHEVHQDLVTDSKI